MFKHGVLLALVAAMRRGRIPLRVVETHAGAGLYDLRGEHALKSKEAEAGVLRLMADPDVPPVFEALQAMVRAENIGATINLYPGSPVQIIQTLERGDAYLGCELRPDDQAALANVLKRQGSEAEARAELGDGYEFAARLPGWGGKTLIVIDPPFESGDEYDQIVEVAARAIERGYALAIWTPIKDLETLDALVSRLEFLPPASLLVAEVRLRALADPMRMNGCAMILIDTPDIEAATRKMAEWVVAHCGDPGGTARVTAT